MRTLIACLLLSLLPGCISLQPDESVNWPAVHKELELWSADLADFQGIVTDPDLAEDLAAISGRLADVDAALEAFIATGGSEHSRLTLVQALNLALLTAEQLVPDDAPDEVRLGMFALRAALRRWMAYMPAGEESGHGVASSPAVE